ncbi:hypothetical protein LAZ67_14000008, partial [Cordylochernes scorpioides]
MRGRVQRPLAGPQGSAPASMRSLRLRGDNSSPEKMNDQDSKFEVWNDSQYIQFKEKYPWLSISKGRLGCNICASVKTLGAAKSERIHISPEWSNYLIEAAGKDRASKLSNIRMKIKKHCESEAHKIAENIKKDRKKKLEEYANNMNIEVENENIKLFRTAYNIAKTNRPYSDYENHITLQTLNGIKLGSTLHSRYSATQIINHIACEMRKMLVAKILSTNSKITILIDESTTLSNKSTLVIFLKAYLGGESIDYIFFDLCELQCQDSENIEKELLNTLYKHGLNEEYLKENWIAIATDGASVMVGRHSGVVTRLKQKFPKLFAWHCLNHRLELSVGDTIKEVRGINHFKAFMDKLYSLYSQSPKNCRALEEACHELGTRFAKVGRILGVRWISSSFRTIKTVWESYESLHHHFKSSTYLDSTYQGLLRRLESPEFILDLGLMYDTLQEMSMLSLELQSRTTTLQNAEHIIKRTIRVIESFKTSPGEKSLLALEAAENLVFRSGVVLASFFWGYALTQVIGGYLSDRVGGARVLAWAAVAWSLVTLTTPEQVEWPSPSLVPLTFARVVEGALQVQHKWIVLNSNKNKLEEIMEIAEKQKIQIIALQETKLNEKYNLKYKNYNILRKDRNKEGGGLAFLIKNLYYEDIAINIPNTSDLEAQGIKVYLNQNKTINIFNMYHPPNNKLIDDGTMAQFLTDNTIIVGDLNAKHQLWGCSTPNPRGKILSNLFDDNAFMCLNDGNPTHHSYSYNTAQALDISFSSPDIFHKCKWQILKSIGSDHLPILIEISTKTKTSSIKEKFWNFKKANWNLYQQNTNEDFRKAPTRIKDLEQNWISFKNTIIKAAKVSIPRGNIKKWIPNYTHQAKDIQTLITKRNELQKKCTQNQTNCRTELNIVNAKIKRLYVNMKREKWKQTCDNLNPRNPNTKLWHLAKQIDRAQPQTENTNMIKNTDGTPATNDKNAANLLGNSYQISSKIKFEIKDKKVEKKARKIIHDCKNVTSTHNIFHEKINMKELDYALENTDLNKTPGPDGIHGQMISNLGKNGKEKLLDIFNNSWKTGKLPQDWKTATIIPIKKLDKSADDPKNYRPISLTSICCKLMEKIILRRLTYHLDTRNLLPKEQYGFRKGHGTIDQLLFFTQKVKDAQNRKPTNHTIAAFLDLTQAFDKGYIRVKYNGTLSKTFKLYQGLPQGSVLSPTLFTLFIAGIEEKISHKTNIGLFADDIILWSSNTNWKKAERDLNKTLFHLEKFANKHKLEFNPQKSETCLFTTDKKLYKIRPKIILKEQQLQYNKHPKYLGYTLDPEINSSKHIEEVIRKGRDRLKILNYISGREWGADATTLKLTYTSLIRPILEYGYQIYGTASETNLKSLERIQLSASRIITGLRNTCPNDIVLYEADIMPLKDRRSYNLPKYINKIKSYGNKHRTSKYILNWESNLRLKKEGPLHLAKRNEFLKYKLEKNYLAEKISPCKPLQNVTFNATLNEPTNKRYQNPEYLKQLSLEIINNIPKNAITIYTDGSRDELGHTGSGCLIKTTNGIEKMNRRNPDFCSVFRSELIAIYEALKSIRNTNYQDIWILTDSRSAIQHLSHTGELRDKVSRNIIGYLQKLSKTSKIHLQWIPSHVGIEGNEAADVLAKKGTKEPLPQKNKLTFKEIEAIAKTKINKNWRIPPKHSWYSGVNPGEALKIRNRQHQTTLTRFRTGHLKPLKIENNNKIYPTCPKCSLDASQWQCRVPHPHVYWLGGSLQIHRQSQTFTKVCLDHGAMINESCTPIPHSMRSDVDLHAASPVAQNKQGRVQDLGRGFCPISIIQSPQTSHFATSKQLSILQCNINGLCSTATKIKLEEIMEIAEKQKIQIIALQETKLNEKYNLKYKNYNILRKDRNKEGGGLAFLIKNLYYEDIAINIPNTSDLEAQGIKVYLNQNKTINIFNMYHPPNNKLIDDGTMAQFLTDNTIIVGDLNAKHQLWGCSTPNPRGKILSNLFDDNAFMCLNDGNPTHHSYSYNTAQALDISFSSPDIFHKCKSQILKSIGSDHLPILIEISTKTKTSSIKEKFWNFKKANWNLYQQNTNEGFRKAPTRIKDLEQNWISFKNTIIKAAKVSIPRGNIKKWIPNYTHQAKDIQTLITKRNELQKKYTQNQTNCRTELNIVNAKIKRLYVNMKREKWKQTCENLNPRNPNTKLWHLAKQIDRAQPQTENTNMIKNIDGTPATNDKNAANVLGNSYQISSKIKFEIKDKKVEKKARKIIHDCKNVTSTYNIFHEKINMKELDYALENTDLNKTPGPDGIHGQMISNLGKNGKEKLLDIFNNSWKTGKLPQDWKTATIIPIKKLDKSADDPKNYRPISLTSICCKLMEKIILRRLTYHLDTRNLLPEEQYGFRKGHGTIDQLLFFTQKVKDAQNRKPTNHTIAAFLDLTQAFDKGYIRVKYNGTLSKTFKLYQGLPQGSVLSPTLFTLFIAGIEEKISHKTNIGLFADDIILWSSNTNWKKAERDLNKTLFHLEKFANKHKLEFNPQKSETCLFTTDKKLYKIRPKIILKEQQLEYNKHPKYLGYTLDPEINSSKHIEEVIRKGRDRLKILNYISGREWGADATTLKLTYTSLIRPILEYGYQIYGTASETNLKSLERIQLSAARIITGLRNTCPNDIVLYEADIMPLKDRRSYNLPKYINKIKSYGNKHRTSKYILNWESNLRLKKEGPLHLAKRNEFLKYKVEKNYLAEKISPCKPLQNVIFNATLNEPTNKQYQNPEYLKQLSLEIINNIPKNAITIYTDGSRDELGHTGSGCLIKTTNGIEKMNRRNPDFCSVFRSELIAIYEALKSIRNTNYQDIWILTDSRSAIQYLSHTGELRDKVSRNIIGYLQKLSKTSKIHLQWIPSHVGIEGNEAADVLAKKGTKEPLPQKNKLTFKEIETIAKTKINKNWRIPPKHSWYSGVNPGGALNIRNRQHQTTLTRFRTGHLKPLKIENNNKIYPTCPKCSLVIPNMEAFAAGSNMSTEAAPPYPWSGTLAEVHQPGWRIIVVRKVLEVSCCVGVCWNVCHRTVVTERMPYHQGFSLPPPDLDHLLPRGPGSHGYHCGIWRTALLRGVPQSSGHCSALYRIHL